MECMRSVQAAISMRVICLLCAPWSISAQPPAITQNGVANMASQIVSSLAGGALARGALIEIRGVRLSAANESPSVNIIKDGSRTKANVVSATARKIQARIPEDAPLGSAKLSVSLTGQESAAFAIEIVESNVGLFSENGLGWGQARANNLDSLGNVVANSAATPAKPSQRVSFAATGMAPRSPLRVLLGGIPAVATWKRTIRTGEEEFAMVIPGNSKEGCSVPLYAMAAPNRASNVITLAVARSGPCIKTVDSPGATRKMVAIFSRTSMRAARAPVKRTFLIPSTPASAPHQW